MGLCCFLLLVGSLPGRTQAAEPAPPLVLERTIPLTGVSGRIDHMEVDLRRGRLFVAELGNGTVDAVDIPTGKIVHRIDGLNEPQGIGYAPQADLVGIASAGDGSVRFFQGENLSPAGSVSLGRDADNVRLDAQTGRLVVGYGGGGLAVIDPGSRTVVADIKLPAHPESFQLGPNIPLAFVNVPDAEQVVAVDLAAGRLVASWRVPGARANFPMALDPAGAILAAVFRNPPRLVLMQTKTGATTANLSTCGDADDVFFDAKRHRLYVSCGEGLVDVLQGEGTSYRPLARIPTRAGARTSLFVPELDRLFVAARAGVLGADAAILVFRPGS